MSAGINDDRVISESSAGFKTHYNAVTNKPLSTKVERGCRKYHRLCKHLLRVCVDHTVELSFFSVKDVVHEEGSHFWAQGIRR